MCPKNIIEDQTRVIFCEDYQTYRVDAKVACPHCDERLASVTTSAPSPARPAYPTPPKTDSPGSSR
jgi:hypothetical protein